MSPPLIAHIGIAVVDLDQAIERYTLLTGQAPVIEDVSDQKVRVAMFTPSSSGGGPAGGRIELVAATSPDSPVAGFIAGHGEGLHHICIYVEDIARTLAELKAAGVRLIDKAPRIGAGGRRIAFVHPSGMNGVLIELEQAPR